MSRSLDDNPPSILNDRYHTDRQRNTQFSLGRTKGGRTQPTSRSLRPFGRVNAATNIQTSRTPTSLIPLGTQAPKPWNNTTHTDDHANHPIDLTQEDSPPQELEADITLPSYKIIQREQNLRKKQIRDYNIDDFTIDGTSDGTSHLLSRLVDEITSIHGDLTPFQRARLAAHAITHHPLRLLEYLKNTNSMNNFVLTSLCNYPLDMTAPYELSPMRTPYLVADDTLRLKMDRYRDLIDEDYRDIIGYYVGSFYPAKYNEIMTHIQGISGFELEHIAHEKGELSNILDGIFPDIPIFSPPEWVDLSTIISHAHVTEPPPQLFDPLLHMGMPTREFRELSPDKQKQIAMAKLPHALAPITTSSNILSILRMLRETPPTRITDFLTSGNFTTHLHPMDNINNNNKFYCRYRLQTIRGKKNTIWSSTPGAILSHWLQAALPIIIPRYSLILSLSPHHTNQEHLPLTSPTTIPPAHILERYTTDRHDSRNTDQILQMDIWLLTSCPDMALTLPRHQDKSKEPSHMNYLSNLTRAAMRASKQEQFPVDVEICLVLVGSSSRDNDKHILAELMERTINTDDAAISLITIAWMSIRTRLDRYSTMAKCILTTTEHAQRIRQMFSSLSPPAEHHLVTMDYTAVTIPPITDSSYDKVMSHTITTQFSTLESTTTVSFQNLNRLDPFTTIPTLTLMETPDPSLPNTRTIAALLLYGQLSIDGKIVTSPVTKVATDTTGSRLYLAAPKSNAGALITFAEHIQVLLPTWTNYMDKPIHLDMMDAKRALHESHTVTRQQTLVTTIQPTHTVQTTPAAPLPPRTTNTTQKPLQFHFPLPPPHPSHSSITMSIDQYNQILGQFNTMFTRMDRTDGAIDEILLKLNDSHTIVTRTEWADSITSAITTTLSSEADSIRDHQLTTSSTQQTQLMIPLNSQTRDIAAQSKLLKSHIMESATSQAEVSARMSQATELLQNAMTEVTLIRRDVIHLVDSVSTLPQAPAPTNITKPNPDSSTNQDIPPLPQPSPSQENQHHQSPATSRSESPASPTNNTGPQQQRGECTACHEFSNELHLCCDCELPFDSQCILAITHRLSDTDEYQCVNCHRKHNPTTQGSTSGLTEPDEDTNSESSTNTGSSTSGVSSNLSDQAESPDTSTTHTKQSKYTNNRKSPPRTRHYTKLIGPDPSDPNHA